MGLLWTLIPDEALILVIAAIGLGLILGIIRGKTAVSMIGGIVLMLLLEPFVESLFAALPWWLTIAVLVVLVLSLLRGLSGLVLGGRASDHMVGILAADIVRFCFVGFFQILAMPFRLIGWLFRRGY
jgi:amino acid transporter